MKRSLFVPLFIAIIEVGPDNINLKLTLNEKNQNNSHNVASFCISHINVKPCKP